MCLSLIGVCWKTTFSFSPKKMLENDEPEERAEEQSSRTTTEEEPNEKSIKVVKKYNKSFSMYAETDLDQPTDYSLRYAEDDSDSDDCGESETKLNPEFLQDTVKTYCTEDTPYETPFNFSNATSMSDLQIVDDKKLDEKLRSEDETPVKTVTNPVDIVDSNTKIKSEFSSGMMSPEKPVSYCEEGTPGYFSRVPSFGSLNSIPVNDSAVKSEPKEEVVLEKCDGKGNKRSVKFEEIVNYTEETPLMFSRSSSLASLDSIEQHSIHDDRSSVVSDFSRLNSGLISPSELPDSPSQTVPPSPKSRKNVIHYPEASTVSDKTESNVSKLRTVQKSSIFEDDVKKFNIESTPVQFSSATSLSSLTIDDQDEETKEEKLETTNDDDSELGLNLEKLDINDESVVPSDESDEEDENILAACINIGMQNNRYSQQKESVPPSTSQKPTFTPAVSPENVNSNPTKTNISTDRMKTYCTEDTPAILSHAGSNSDLSVLSMQGTECNIDKDYDLDSTLFDDDEDDDDELLQDCIKRGMAQLAKSPPKTNGNETLSSPNNYEHNGLDISLESNNSDNNLSRRSSMSSISECEKVLLEECIRAGMPKTSKSNNNVVEESSDLTEAEQELLQQCILDGMKSIREKPSNSYKATSNNRNSDLTEKERALLKRCILLGMQNANHLRSAGPSASFRNSTELSESEQALLEQCIQAGMPKSRPSSSKSEQSSHACCIHCPRNQQGASNMTKTAPSPSNNYHTKMRRRTRGQEKFVELPVRDARDVNMMYITSHILAMKKALVDRSHEEWV